MQPERKNIKHCTQGPEKLTASEAKKPAAKLEINISHKKKISENAKRNLIIFKNHSVGLASSSMFLAVGWHWIWSRNTPHEKSISIYISLSNRAYGLVYMLEVKLGFKNRIFTSALLPMGLILVPQAVTAKSLWETALRALPSSVPEIRPCE